MLEISKSWLDQGVYCRKKIFHEKRHTKKYKDGLLGKSLQHKLNCAGQVFYKIAFLKVYTTTYKKTIGNLFKKCANSNF